MSFAAAFSSHIPAPRKGRGWGQPTAKPLSLPFHPASLAIIAKLAGSTLFAAFVWSTVTLLFLAG